MLRGFCSKIVAFKYVSSTIIMPIEGNTYLNMFRDFFPLKIIVRNSLLISHNVYFCTWMKKIQQSRQFILISNSLYYMTSFIMDPASIIAYFLSLCKWQVSFINLSLFFPPLFFLEGGGEVGLKFITGAMGKSRAEIQGIYRPQILGT